MRLCRRPSSGWREEEGKCDEEEEFPLFLFPSSEETEKLILPSDDLGHVRGQRQ